jgi:hypothetical protein
MASIVKRTTPGGEVRWDVRYRGTDRRQVKRSFKRRSDAQRFANLVEADVLRGDWIDPAAPRRRSGTGPSSGRRRRLISSRRPGPATSPSSPSTCCPSSVSSCSVSSRCMPFCATAGNDEGAPPRRGPF